MKRLLPFALLATLLLVHAPLGLAQDKSVDELEEEAFRDAVEQVAGLVVQIQTVGGLERISAGRSSMLVGTGPTTGLVVSADGYVISSAFNFIQKPTSILVRLPDGSRAPAKLIATDFSRKLTLLKVDAENLKLDLPVPEAAPTSDIRVGQWGIAVGRTFEGTAPNVSVGIISAVNRIWGKAIQTDAKISPSNYGGPLIDIHGRVQGVLVPMSPQGNTDLAGVEWYDSGIGFAVPLADINRVLPKLKEGTDLHPGVMGIAMKGRDQLADKAVIGTVRAGSPAAEAGLKAGDQVLEIDGTQVERPIQVKLLLGPRYADEELKVVVLREKEQREFTVKLVAKLTPYQHPFLGVLPLRTAQSEKDGVRVRYVYAGSAADKAGIKIGDVIKSIDGTEVSRRDDMLETMNGLKPSQQVEVVLTRDGKEMKVQADLTGLPLSVPAELPPAGNPTDLKPPEQKPEVGTFADRSVTDLKNTYLAYVPENYHPEVPHGVIVWLHKAGGFDDDKLVATFKPLCEQYGLILLAPRAEDKNKWNPREVQFLRKMLDDVLAQYNVDRSRIIAGGTDVGGSMAYLLAFQQRELIRGVVALDAPLPRNPGENEPNQRLSMLVSKAAKSKRLKQIEASIDRLVKMKFPVTVLDQPEDPHELDDGERATLGRWLDTLDRL